MPSNLKKRVRARMEKTGETYQKALANVRRRGGENRSRFEKMARHVIELASARNAEAKMEARRTPDARKRLMRFVEHGMLPREQALLDYLKSLPWEDIRKVEVVMYSGREQDHPFEVHRTLYVESRNVTVSIVHGKSPLDEYLESGLELARRLHVDLDAPLSKWQIGSA